MLCHHLKHRKDTQAIKGMAYYQTRRSLRFAPSGVEVLSWDMAIGIETICFKAHTECRISTAPDSSFLQSSKREGSVIAEFP
jgi:hypothetical protein